MSEKPARRFHLARRPAGFEEQTAMRPKLNFNTIVPALLITLAAVPVLGGVMRLAQLSGATIDFLPESDRVLAAASPAFVLHIASGGFYFAVGAFQFSDGLRRRRPGLHRRMGFVVAIAGLLAAMTALWLTLFFPRANNDNDLLQGIRLIVAPAMALFIVFGITDAMQRNLKRHQAWMMRGYALGAGAGTQVLLHVLWVSLFAEPGTMTRAILMGSAWAINLLIAEWFISRKHRFRRQTSYSGALK